MFCEPKDVIKSGISVGWKFFFIVIIALVLILKIYLKELFIWVAELRREREGAEQDLPSAGLFSKSLYCSGVDRGPKPGVFTPSGSVTWVPTAEAQ